MAGPYIGQMKAVLQRTAPDVPVIDLFSNLPPFNPRAAAYLLASFVDQFPEATVFLCVVDPGVGSESRLPVVVDVDSRWFVGPNNGIFDLVARRGSNAVWTEIIWKPEQLSNTFHGRDLFAPVAASLARGERVEGRLLEGSMSERESWPDELYEVVYIDDFGNAMVGTRAHAVPVEANILANGYEFARCRTYADVADGATLWYENSNGLVELAINRGDAARRYGIKVGTPVSVCNSG